MRRKKQIIFAIKFSHILKPYFETSGEPYPPPPPSPSRYGPITLLLARASKNSKIAKYGIYSSMLAALLLNIIYVKSDNLQRLLEVFARDDHDLVIFIA